MLRNILGIYYLDPRPFTFPDNLATLMDSLATQRTVNGLTDVKLLSAKRTLDNTITVDDIERQAQLCGLTLSYKVQDRPDRYSGIETKIYPTAFDLLWAIRNKARRYSLADSEVQEASGLTAKAAKPYLRGRVPDNPSLLNICILAETLSMDVQFILTRLEATEATEATPIELTNTVN